MMSMPTHCLLSTAPLRSVHVPSKSGIAGPGHDVVVAQAVERIAAMVSGPYLPGGARGPCAAPHPRTRHSPGGVRRQARLSAYTVDPVHLTTTAGHSGPAAFTRISSEMTPQP
jgi:hypothetical protein